MFFDLLLGVCIFQRVAIVLFFIIFKLYTPISLLFLNIMYIAWEFGL